MGPSTVTVGCGGGALGGAGGCCVGATPGTPGWATEARGPSEGIPAPPPTPPAAAPAAPVSKEPAENGADRDRVSVPYQNSVASADGRARVRMMRGVIDSTSSLFSISVLFEPNKRPMNGSAVKPGRPVWLRVSEA